MKKKATVYLICGFIGAGKTTFARKLEARTGAMRITKDEWLIRLIGHDPSIEGYAALDSKICGLSRAMAFQLAEKGMDVILDEGFWAREEREEMLQHIAAIGAQSVLCHVDTPMEEMRKRLILRNGTPRDDAFAISPEMWEQCLKHWQPPEPDEPCVLAQDLLV